MIGPSKIQADGRLKHNKNNIQRIGFYHLEIRLRPCWLKNKTTTRYFYKKYSSRSSAWPSGTRCKCWPTKKASLCAYWHTDGTRVVPDQL